jgi:peptidoglycan biosynthesis protein MviN/MurJ (putative lipid II flippase)
LPFQATSKLYYAAINASGNTVTPVKFSTVSLIINITVSLLLMKFTGFKCVAIATVVSSASQFILLMNYCEKKCYKLSADTRKDIVKCVIATTVMLIILYNLSSHQLTYRIFACALSYFLTVILLKAEIKNDLFAIRDKIT